MTDDPREALPPKHRPALALFGFRALGLEIALRNGTIIVGPRHKVTPALLASLKLMESDLVEMLSLSDQDLEAAVRREWKESREEANRTPASEFSAIDGAPIFVTNFKPEDKWPLS
jgi:hypothetical protein